MLYLVLRQYNLKRVAVRLYKSQKTKNLTVLFILLFVFLAIFNPSPFSSGCCFGVKVRKTVCGPWSAERFLIFPSILFV